MDFVKKKAFEAQINKVGKDFGLGSNVTSTFSGGNREQPRTPGWNVFSLGDDNDSPELHADDGPGMSPAVVSYYESLPNNFPPVVRLFYVDQSILSEAAKRPVWGAFFVLCTMEVLLVLNTLVSLLFTILDAGENWYFLLISAAVTVLLSLYELFIFEIAFRGAYQTSTRQRMQYLYLSATNVLPMILYAFIGVGFFNGWMRVGYLDEKETREKLNQPALRKVFSVIEALLWTILLFVSVYAFFEYYHLVKGREQGLSAEAIAAANRAQSGEDPDSSNVVSSENAQGRGGVGGGTNSRIQAIRDRYRAEQV